MNGRAALAFLALLSILACAAEEATPQLEARVTKIKDGDSFSATLDGGPVEVRIFGIDAPERGQPWSNRSRTALQKLIEGRKVVLRPVEEDAYGRVVAWVDVGDRCVACMQLREGHAWVFLRYTDDPELLALEEEARSGRRGLWKLPERDRVPPWEWRGRRPRR